MRTALPNAAFSGFTGTPLIVGEEKTRQVFGDYVSIYDFQQSVADGATVPLYYENRIPELQLVNENLNEDMDALLEEAELDEEQEKKLEREFAREYHLITRDDRLEAVAKDIVAPFHRTGLSGQGHGDLHRQGHGRAHVRQGEEVLGRADCGVAGRTGWGEATMPAGDSEIASPG